MMTNSIRYQYIVLSLFLLLGIYAIKGQQKIGAQYDNDVSLDPSIRSGRLSNGLTYYIKNVHNTAQKIHMRLYVKVGSHYQNPEQLEFAHAIEHLAFKCARDFPVNLLDDSQLLNGLGMSKKDIFAQTWDYSTWYRFDVPSDRIDAVEKGLQWFGNISNLNLTKEAIEKEKGPLRQELIYRQGDDLEGFFLKTKLNSLLFPCHNDFTQFFEHNKNYDPDSLIHFYRKWYRPDRMGVVVVGNIENMDGMEKRIRREFSSLKGIGGSNRLSDCNGEYMGSEEKFIVLERNPRNGQREVDLSLYIRDPKVDERQGSWAGLQEGLIWEILFKCINLRLRHSEETYGAPFSASFYPPSPYFPALDIGIKTDVEHVKRSLDKTILILRQLKTFGVTEEEWASLRQEQLDVLEKTDTTASKYWLGLIQDNFIYGEALPQNKNVYLGHWLSQLTLQEFNAQCTKMIVAKPSDIGMIVPSGYPHTKDEIRLWVQEPLSEAIAPYISPNVPKQLLRDEERIALEEVTYANKGTLPSGATEYLLDNGVRIILDTLVSTKGKFYLHAFNATGASRFSQDDYFSAINAPSIIQNAGAGNFDKFEIDRFLKEKGKGLWIRPYIDYNESGIKGQSTVADLEKMLQLVYLYFVHPNKNEKAFQDWKTRERNWHLNPSYGIVTEDFNVMVREFLGDSSIAPQGTERLHGIDRTDHDSAYRIYERLFGNASDFTFILSGDFLDGDVLPMIRKYLGNLPNLPDRTFSAHKNKRKDFPKGPLVKTFYADEIGAGYGMESVPYYLKFISAPDGRFDWKERLNVEILGSLMRSKLFELRFLQDAALYNIHAVGSFNMESKYVDFGMMIDVAPGELPALRKACKGMVREVKEDLLDEQRFKEVMYSTIYPRYGLDRQYNAERRTQKTYEFLRYGTPWASAIEIQEYVKSLTVGDIKSAAQIYLKKENMMEFIYQENRGKISNGK
ncbi:MAG: insulinase family protein [Sediminicola sp.]